MKLTSCVEIIPAILESSWPEVEKKLKLVDGLTEWIQLDVSDGRFTPSTTWSDPQDLFSARSDSKIEVHLMINEPWLKAEEWLSSPVKRIVAQVEAFGSPDSVRFGEIINIAKKYGKEVVWGFKIETPWQDYKELFQSISRVLFLSVQPGRQGQEFDRRVLEKIFSLCREYPGVKIEVDGGVNPNVAGDLKSAGADALVVGSYIFDSPDPKKAIDMSKA